MLKFGILGPIELYDGRRPVPIGGRRQVALLACLLLNANRPVSPDALIEAVWGPRAPEATLEAVRMAIARLRKTLRGAAAGAQRQSPLETVASGYVLRAAPGECDADVAAELIDAGRTALSRGNPGEAATRLREALKLWRGPVLADVEYEDFAQSERNRLEELRMSALEPRIEAELELGSHAALVPELEALVVEHPGNERIAHHLILALYRCGRQADALEAYQQFRAHCIDSGLEPGPQLKRLQADVLAHAPSLHCSGAGAAPPPGTTLPEPEGTFVGRRALLDRLRSHWERSLTGMTRQVLVKGEPGVGKTRLAVHFAEEVRRDGAVTLYGRAEEDALRPFQPFAEVLDQLVYQAGPDFEPGLGPELEALSHVFPNVAASVSASPDDRQDRFQIFQAFVRVLVHACERSPLALILDDLHWADKPTLLLLRHLLRYTESHPLLVIGTFRDAGSHHQLNGDDELKTWLVQVSRERLLDELLTVQGLDVKETHTLVTDRLGVSVTAELIRRLQDRTAGNAFFIEETVRALGDLGVAEHAALDSDALEQVGVPESVREAILQRQRRLTRLATDLLAVAAVMGRAVDLEMIGRVVGATSSEVVAAAEEIANIGLLTEVSDRGDMLMFAHDVVREVLYESLSAPRRLLLHYDVGRMLEAVGSDRDVSPGELAHHFHRACQLAGSSPPRKYADPARRHKIEAGRRAANLYAYEDAARHFCDALELLDTDDDAGRCDLLLRLGRVRSKAGATLDADRLWRVPARARDAFLAAFECAQRVGDAQRLARAALGVGERYFEMTYSDSNHLDLLEEALIALGPEDNWPRAMLLARLAENLAFPHEDPRAHALVEEALAMARRLGDEQLLFAVLLARHVTLLDVAYLEDRLAIDAELSTLAAGHTELVAEQPELVAEQHFCRIYDLLEAGELRGARRDHARLDELANKLGQPLYRSIAAGAAGLFAELEGDLAGAERWAAESRAHAANARTLDAKSAWAGQVLRRRLLEGSAEGLASLTMVVEELAAAGGHKLGWRSALGVLRLEAGRTSEARHIYEEELGDGPAGLPRGMFRLTHLAVLSELAARLEDAAGAEALYSTLLPYRTRNVAVAYSSFWGPVEGVLGQLAAAFGDRAAQRTHTEVALRSAREMGARLEARQLEARLNCLMRTVRRGAPRASSESVRRVRFD